MKQVISRNIWEGNPSDHPTQTDWRHSYPDPHPYPHQEQEADEYLKFQLESDHEKQAIASLKGVFDSNNNRLYAVENSIQQISSTVSNLLEQVNELRNYHKSDPRPTQVQTHH